MAKNSRSCFPSAVLLTTLICSHYMTTKFYLPFCDYEITFLGACDTPLEKVFSRPFKRYITSPKYKVSVGKSRKTNLQFSDCRTCGQKNHNGKMTAVLLCYVFYKCSHIKRMVVYEFLQPLMDTFRERTLSSIPHIWEELVTSWKHHVS